ncbi:MAG: MGMT family protein, partial [Thermoplasmata archaeon]|nr:MGMT family protein [Thermoplasmata archaeon]
MRFTREVTGLVEQIPKGKISTYGDIARALGDVVASRTVYAIIKDRVDGAAPIHRVVRANGEAPYSRHLQILEEEGVPVRRQKVRNVPDHLFTDFKSSQILVKLREEQEALASKVSLEDGFQKASTIGGIDVA